MRDTLPNRVASVPVNKRAQIQRTNQSAWLTTAVMTATRLQSVIQGGRKEPGRGANPRLGRYALRRSARLSPKTGGRGGQLMRGE